MVRDEKDPFVSQGYSIPASLVRQVKEEAARQDVGASTVVRRALRQYLQYLRQREIEELGRAG